MGILLGQGFLPGAATAISDLSGQLSKIQDMVKSRETYNSRPQRKTESDPELAFYERLETTKDDVKKEHRPIPKSNKPKDSKPQVKPVVPKSAGPELKEPSKTAEPKRTESPPAITTETSFTVQVASLGEEDNAASMTSQLIRQGYPAYYYRANVDGTALYRVRCGRFLNREEADKFVQKLIKEIGLKGFVTRIE